MSTDLLDQLTSEFRGDTLNRVASAIGESATKTERALTSVLPALIGGLAHKISTPEEASNLLDVMRRNKLDSSQYASVASAITAPDGIKSLMNVGRTLLDSLFGGRAASLTDWLSSYAGLNRSASSSLLSLAVPLVLGQFARRVSADGWTPSSLLNLLAGQRTLLKDAPADLAGALGLAEATASTRLVGTYETETSRPPVVGTYEKVTVAATPPPPEPAYVRTYETPQKTGIAWWKWVLPLLLIGLLGWWLLRRQEPRREAIVEPAPAPRADVAPTTAPPPEPAPATPEPMTIPAPVVPALGEFFDRKLPDTITLHIPERGVEAKLIAFIEDPNKPVDKETWFSFDRIEFDTASAQLRPSSQEQIRNIAAILKAYPQVNVKIGGYTDNVGDDAANLKLSHDRAVSTMNAIVSNGIDASRLEAEGYGEQHPVATNDTDEGRQRNRRIDIRVTKK
jgi:OmpA-OmpF porin, OOP family